MKDLKKAIEESGFLQNPGFYAIVDGQFGSTGKGLLASVMAEHCKNKVTLVTSNAGPNSGHTSIYRGKPVVLQQLPTFSVMHKMFHGDMPVTELNAGAVIDYDQFVGETTAYCGPNDQIVLNGLAAFIQQESKDIDKSIVERIGSTGKGTGAAIAAKVMRDKNAVAVDGFSGRHVPPGVRVTNPAYHDVSMSELALTFGQTVLAEVSQGFSLSLNAGPFYPYCTSRDCTIQQAMSDAGVHPSHYRDCAMVVRTYPIRVAGNSGPHYPDQEELAWETVGQKPELTTVTKKVRRIFTWSKRQFSDAVRVNKPGVVMVNFMNYLPDGVDHQQWLNENVLEVYYKALGCAPNLVLLGYGPNNEDVRVM